jgi:hypothetical protein
VSQSSLSTSSPALAAAAPNESQKVINHFMMDENPEMTVIYKIVVAITRTAVKEKIR